MSEYQIPLVAMKDRVSWAVSRANDLPSVAGKERRNLQSWQHGDKPYVLSTRGPSEVQQNRRRRG